MRILLAILPLGVIAFEAAFARAQAGEKSVVQALAFAPDGASLAVGLNRDKKGELQVRATRGEVIWRRPQSAPIRAIRWLGDGKTLAVAVGPSLLLVDAATGKTRKTLGPHGKRILALAVGKGGRLLATAGEGTNVLLWDAEKGVEVGKLPDPGPVYSLALSADGKHLLAASDREARLWDVEAGKLLHRPAHSSFFISSAAFSPDGKEVLTGGYDGTARLWNVATGKPRLLFVGKGGLRGVAFAPGPHGVALWSDRHLSLFSFDRRLPDAATAARVVDLMKQIDDDRYSVREEAESALVRIGFVAEPILRQAAQGSASAEVRIRCRRILRAMASQPRRLIDLPGTVRSVAFSADGRQVACGFEDGSVRLYDPRK